MKSWKMYCTGLMLAAGLAPAALAQGLPAITPPANLTPVNPPVNAPAPPAAQPPNIWDKLCPRADQKAACKAKICASPIGQLLNNMLSPAGALTGGIVGPFCPTISAADLAKPPDSAEGAAARLKADEADAAARRAAIRYMAGADCHYWPEVTEALIGALRADRNECVRMEAALALGRGCCCNRATMLALTLTISGSTADGNPAEDSERVKCAATAALNHCLANYTEVVPAPAVEPIKTNNGGGDKPPPIGDKPIEPLPPPKPPMTLNERPSPTDFYHHAANLQEKSVVEAARHAVEHVTPVSADAPSPVADHSLFGIARAAMTGPSAPSGPITSTAPTVVVMEKPTTPTGILPALMMQPTKASPPMPTVAPAMPAVAPAAPPSAGVAPAGYTAPASRSAVTPPLPPARVSTGAPSAPAGMNPAVIASTIAVLHDSINPQERETAAAALGACDGWSNPNVVQALIEAARSDAAPLVRAASLRSLTRMNIRTLPVATVAQALKTDPDPRVRTEAEEAIKQISGPSRAQ